MMYKYQIEHARAYDWFYAVVLFDGYVIARKACIKNHRRAGRWAARQIKAHKKALSSVKKVS